MNTKPAASNDAPRHAMCGRYVTHYFPRADAVWHIDRDYVPTVWGQKEGNTIYLNSWAEFKAANGAMHWNEDQTEIVLSLPVGHKFGIQFMDKNS